MKTREEMLAIQEQFLQLHHEVEAELKSIPGVVGVGIGFKEVDGVLTDEVSFRVYVQKKKEQQEVSPAQMIPKTIRGFKTDVIEFEITETIEDDSRYRPVKGGIQIGNGTGGVGTLGCLAKLNSDNSWVVLSNHHVMMTGGKQLADKVKIGQPDYSNCCCCSCGEIGEVINASIGGLVDCAIAKLNSDITFVNEINGIGALRGTASAVLGETVRKVGRTTGLTTGSVVDIAYVADSTAGNSFTSQIKIDPVAGVTKFADKGDSGSVIVNVDDKVIGLLWGAKVFGAANHISNVLTAMDITIQTSAGTPTTSLIKDAARPARVFVEKYPELSELADLELADDNPFIEIVERHSAEMFRLIRYNRQVMTVWQRKQGPAFVAAFWRSYREKQYSVPFQIGEVTFANLLMSMNVALEETGSESLRQFLREHGLDIIQSAHQCRTLTEIIEELNALGKSLPVDEQPSFN